MQENTLVGPDGKRIFSVKTEPCPQCGRPPEQRVPSAGFGTYRYMVCFCGYEFKELLCPKYTV